jgi:hypothetical protein
MRYCRGLDWCKSALIVEREGQVMSTVCDPSPATIDHTGHAELDFTTHADFEVPFVETDPSIERGGVENVVPSLYYSIGRALRWKRRREGREMMEGVGIAGLVFAAIGWAVILCGF